MAHWNRPTKGSLLFIIWKGEETNIKTAFNNYNTNVLNLRVGVRGVLLAQNCIQTILNTELNCYAVDSKQAVFRDEGRIRPSFLN